MTLNPSTPDTIGLEWLVAAEPSSFVLDSQSRALGQYLPGAALKRSQAMAAYADLVSGVGIFGCEVHSAPRVENVPQTTIIAYAGTDTGADFTSPQNGGNAWLTQAGGAASYASVSPGVDDTTYLKNVNQVEGPVPCRMMMRGAGAQTVLAGRRILDVELRVRVKSTLVTSPTFYGCVNISGNDYRGPAIAVPVGQGYVELSLVKWTLNPATERPWTIGDVNLIATATASDEMGLLATWDASYTTSYADTIRVVKVWALVRTHPEDRLGYAYGEVSATGWQDWTSKSVPNLLPSQDSVFDTDTASVGTWVADSNTTLTNDTDDPGGSYTRSLKIDPTAAGAAGGKPGYSPCIAGKTYSLRALGKGTSGRNIVCSIEFYDANNTLLQTSSGPTDVATGSYAAIGFTSAATAPTGATQMKPHIVLTATAGTDTLYVSQIFLGLAESAITFVRVTSPGGASITKVNGSTETSSIAHPTDELRIFRRIKGDGNMSLPMFGPGDSAVGMPLGLYSYRATLQDGAGALQALGSTYDDCTAIVTTSLTGWDSANGPIDSLSQVYARRIPALVNTGNTLQQELTTPVDTYLAVRLVVAGEIDVPAASLTVKLKKRSDDSQVGGTATIAPTDLDQIVPPTGGSPTRATPRTVVVALASSAVTGAVQHYVELASTAADGSGWVVYAMDTMGLTVDSVSIDTLTFGSTTDAFTNPGDGGEQTRRDAMVTIQTQPAAPTGVTAALSGSAVVIGWTGTGLGATFAATEIWRTNDRSGVDSDGYQQVADLTDEAQVQWTDYEVRRGVNAQYKIRTRRTDGSLSPFSTATAGVVPLVSEGPQYLFVSNEADSSYHVRAEGLGDQTYTPPVGRVLREFYGRDGAVAFIPLELSLDEWEAEIALYWAGGSLPDVFLQDPPVAGRAAFYALEALSVMSLSYVCILDCDGNRWYANLAVLEMRRSPVGGSMPGGYIATIHVRELTRTPSTPTGSP